MDLTKEDWSAWKANPCTKEMVRIVEEAITAAKDESRGRDTIDETIKNAHFVDGWCVGAGEILDIMEDIADED